MNTEAPSSRAPRARVASMGADGFFMLVLSVAWIGLTGGLAFAWSLRKVCRAAVEAPTADVEARVVGPRVVLGVCPVKGGMPADFEARLNRLVLLPPGPVILLGGRTGRHVPRSEAEMARAWLEARGKAEGVIALEGRSRNTVENLQALRDILARDTATPVLISNRYHMARIRLIADGLKLDHRVCAAENRFRLTPRIAGRLILEAMFVNWYIVGRGVARALKQRAMLTRIT